MRCEGFSVINTADDGRPLILAGRFGRSDSGPTEGPWQRRWHRAALSPPMPGAIVVVVPTACIAAERRRDAFGEGPALILAGVRDVPHERGLGLGGDERHRGA